MTARLTSRHQASGGWRHRAQQQDLGDAPQHRVGDLMAAQDVSSLAVRMGWQSDRAQAPVFRLLWTVNRWMIWEREWPLTIRYCCSTARA
jgi:hypothetical protein